MARSNPAKPKPATDREVLDQSLNWPYWPTLPLTKHKHEHNEEDCGFLYSFDREPEPVVYFGNIFCLGEIAAEIKLKTGQDQVTYQEILATFKHRRFASLDEVLETYRID